jgi:uncharacterized protein YjbI with pentapeptide repeats
MLYNSSAYRILKEASDKNDIDIWNRFKKNNKDEKINLFFANLSSINLKNADLRGVDFRCAELRDCDFSNADVDGANISFFIYIVFGVVVGLFGAISSFNAFPDIVAFPVVSVASFAIYKLLIVLYRGKQTAFSRAKNPTKAYGFNEKFLGIK